MKLTVNGTQGGKWVCAPTRTITVESLVKSQLTDTRSAQNTQKSMNILSIDL